MKKTKKIITLFILGICILLPTGCVSDSMDGITISTSSYPIEYITKSLYEDHSEISKLYPDDVDINTYKITNKLLKDTSNNNLFIYNGLGKDKDMATKLLGMNKKIKIIDSTYGMSSNTKNSILWLDPSNMLMIAQNIKNGLKEYVSNTKLNEEIDNNYNELKINLSELDAELKLIGENSTYKNIVVANNELNFLTKYGFNVYCIEENKDLTEKTIYDVKYLFDTDQTNYIIALEGTKETNTIKSLKENNNAEIIYLNSLNNITEEERKNEANLITLFNNNLDLIKKETYNN